MIQTVRLKQNALKTFRPTANILASNAINMKKKMVLFKLKKPRTKVKPPKVIAHGKTYNRKKLKTLDKKENL
jgi:hypothetical protein